MPRRKKYVCPHNCGFSTDSIKGWKQHLSKTHDGYAEEQLARILGTVAPDSEQGRIQFLSEAGKVPDLPIGQATEGQDESKTTATGEPAPKPTTELKTDAVAKRFSGKLNKMKKALAEKVPRVLNEAIKDKGPEWQLGTDDSEMLAESIENCFEVLDIDFRITPFQTVLTNPLWVLLLPLLVLIAIFVPKAIAQQKQKPEPAPEEVPADEVQATPIVAN